MSVDTGKVTALVNALLAKFENKQTNKKNDITGDYTQDTNSYPTVQAVKGWVTGLVNGKQDTLVSGTNIKTVNNNSLLGSGNITIEAGTDVDIATSWGSPTSNDKVPSEKLTKDTLDLKLNITDAFSGDYDDLTDKPTIPSKISDLTNDSDFIETSSTSGLIKNDGSIDTTSYSTFSGNYNDLTNKPTIPDVSGKIDTAGTGLSKSGTTLNHSNSITAVTTAAFKKFKYDAQGHITGVANVAASDLPSHTHSSYDVTLEEQGTADTGYAKTYVIKQGGTALSPKINIPKDFLVKSGSVKTCTTANVPVQGYVVGDKYLDFVVNVHEGSATDEHIYILVSELVDAYSADNSTLQLSNANVFSVKDGGVTKTKLATAVQTSLGYADNWNSSAAKNITSSDITAWNGAVTNMLTISDVDGEIDDYIDAIVTALSN